MTGRLSGVLLLGFLLTGCASVPDESAGSKKILVTPGAYRLIQQNHQATAVFEANAHMADSELICERILYEGYKEVRTLCYARDELEGTQRQHRDKFQELTLFPGSGG